MRLLTVSAKINEARFFFYSFIDPPSSIPADAEKGQRAVR